MKVRETVKINGISYDIIEVVTVVKEAEIVSVLGVFHSVTDLIRFFLQKATPKAQEEILQCVNNSRITEEQNTIRRTHQK